MFCPTIKEKCVGEDCRDWDKENNQCRALTETRRVDEMYREVVGHVKLNMLWSKLSLMQLADSSIVPEHVKDIIRRALEAPSAEVAERLLKEEGLL